MDIIDTVFVESFKTHGVLLKDSTIKVFVNPGSIISEIGNFYITIDEVTELFIDGKIDMKVWKKCKGLFHQLEEHFHNKTKTE